MEFSQFFCAFKQFTGKENNATKDAENGNFGNREKAAKIGVA